jgi:hypothetical protein
MVACAEGSARAESCQRLNRRTKAIPETGFCETTLSRLVPPHPHPRLTLLPSIVPDAQHGTRTRTRPRPPSPYPAVKS